MKIGLVFALVGSAVALGGAAFAQTPAAPSAAITAAPYSEQMVEGNQVVSFRDDALPGDVNSAYGFTLRRPPGVLRQLLIRPRVNFVSELVKSVENL